MKQTFAFLLAIAMLATMSSMVFATETVDYPVAGISSKAYVLDDDGHIDLSDSVDKVNYGKAVYFPLLSKTSSVVSEKEKALRTAENDFSAAETAYKTLEKTYANYKDYDKVLTEYNTAYKNDINAATTINTTLGALQQKVSEANVKLEEAKKEVERIEKIYKDWVDAGSLDSGLEKDALDALKPSYDDAKKTAESDVTTKDTAVTNAKDAVALKTAQNNLLSTTGTTTVDLAKEKINTANTKMKSASDKIKSKEKAVTTAKTDYENAQKSSDKYHYVHEPDAVDKVKISKKWEENGNYARNVDVLRKRLTSTLTDANNKSIKYIYFLEIKIRSSSSTQDRDLYGNVTLKMRGTNGFEVSNDISIELGYGSASKSEGVITDTPTTFKEGSGFDEDSEYRFEFEKDSKSSFVVKTVGQGRIVLGFDTDPDDDIYEKYPEANLEFFNGNYASFNRVGKLYLGYDDDDGYVYSISKDGTLSRVHADWNEDEEAYEISTRTLGRYVISDRKLKITSASKSSSSSSSSSAISKATGGVGTTTITPGASSVPSYNYTPPVASSSVAPPAQSSSSSEESSESEEPEESESELEDEDEDEIVPVVIDDEEAEGPEEKSGVAGWVWALLIVGLAAVPVAIGVVYYIHSRPIRRDFFDNDDNDE